MKNIRLGLKMRTVTGQGVIAVDFSQRIKSYHGETRTSAPSYAAKAFSTGVSCKHQLPACLDGQEADSNQAERMHE